MAPMPLRWYVVYDPLNEIELQLGAGRIVVFDRRWLIRIKVHGRREELDSGQHRQSHCGTQ